jgi:hypothetical protein
MEETPVDSSVIRLIGYDRDSSTLLVVFRDGHVYEFFLVPPSVYEAFLQAPSKGRFFNDHFLTGPYGRRKTRKK